MKKYNVYSKSIFARILRHNPEIIGITLDENGWADVADLLRGLNDAGRQIDTAELEQIVLNDSKRRFAFNADKTKIRANQGHSVNVEVQPQETAPPEFLYHGTAAKYIDGIRANGINKRSRLYVHLSFDVETAVKVGSRHGKPTVLVIDAKKMYADGFKFYLSANGVWLTDYVPFEYVVNVLGM